LEGFWVGEIYGFYGVYVMVCNDCVVVLMYYGGSTSDAYGNYSSCDQYWDIWRPVLIEFINLRYSKSFLN